MSRQSGDDISDKYCVLPSDIFRLSLLNETETANIFINYYHKITFTLISKLNKIILYGEMSKTHNLKIHLTVQYLCYDWHVILFWAL